MKGYRTMLLNGAAVVVPLIDYFVSNAPALGPKGTAIVSALGTANMMLRLMTNTPAFNKQ